MFLAAFGAAQHDPTRAYYDRKRSEETKCNAAVIRLALKRGDIVLAMLKTATPDQPHTSENLTEAA